MKKGNGRRESGDWRTEVGKNGERRVETGKVLLLIEAYKNKLTMNKIEKFEDLNVWQNAIELTSSVYAKLRECKDYGFKDQVCRASVSVPSNITEGFERQYNKEYVQFLYIAKGSIGEVRTQLTIAQRLNYINLNVI